MKRGKARRDVDLTTYMIDNDGEKKSGWSSYKVSSNFENTESLKDALVIVIQLRRYKMAMGQQTKKFIFQRYINTQDLAKCIFYPSTALYSIIIVQLWNGRGRQQELNSVCTNIFPVIKQNHIENGILKMTFWGKLRLVKKGPIIRQ